MPARRSLFVVWLSAWLVAGCGAQTADLPSLPPGLPVAQGAQQATVVRHVDGDTVVLRGRGVGPLPATPTKVRLLLIDTPEVFVNQECFGPQASDRTAELLPVGDAVRVEADRDQTDRYGRTLLHVWTGDGVEVGQALLRGGFATVLVVQPNERYLADYRRAEQQADRADEGLWQACR